MLGCGAMSNVLCPVCLGKMDNYEVVLVAPDEKRYEIKCPNCGKIFSVYGKDIKEFEGQHS
jgi:uncharacterized Zn finger protein